MQFSLRLSGLQFKAVFWLEWRAFYTLPLELRLNQAPARAIISPNPASELAVEVAAASLQQIGIGIHDGVGPEGAIVENFHVVGIVQIFADEGNGAGQLVIALVVSGHRIGEGAGAGGFGVIGAEQHRQPSRLGIGDSGLRVGVHLLVFGSGLKGDSHDIALRAGGRAAAAGRIGGQEARRTDGRRVQHSNLVSSAEDFLGARSLRILVERGLQGDRIESQGGRLPAVDVGQLRLKVLDRVGAERVKVPAAGSMRPTTWVSWVSGSVSWPDVSKVLICVYASEKLKPITLSL